MRLNWWKIGLIGTFLWLLIFIGVVAWGAYEIITHPMGQAVDDARAQRLGQGLGMFSGICLAGVWYFAWTRRRREQDSMSLPPARRHTHKRL